MLFLCAKKRWRNTGCLLIVFVMLVVFITEPITAYGKEDTMQLYAKAAVLMDAESGRVLYGKNEKEIMPMASTTKIMTCILALEHGNLEEMAEVSAYAAGMPKVKLNVRQGETYRVIDLLYSLMLESHNDSAVVIAEKVGGSVENFAKMMNQKARDIGCYDTFFITPNGLDAMVNDTGKIHSTTATDLAKIMAYCVTDSPAKEKFLEITRTKSYGFCDGSGKRNFTCNNHNAFLSMMEEALSGKTGFTNNAGYCYVGAVESEGRIFTVALLACGWPNHKEYKWKDMKKLSVYGLEKYQYKDIYKEQTFAPIEVQEGIGMDKDTDKPSPFSKAMVEVVVEDDGEKSMPYLLCDEDEISVKTQVKKSLTAPVKKGEKVGSISYYLNGEQIKEYPVLTAKSVEKCSYIWIFTYLLKGYLI